MGEVDGYLLDTNHVVPLLRQDQRGAAILARIASVSGDSPIYIATVALAELEVGCCLFQGKTRSESQDEIREIIEVNGIAILEFTKHTARHYADLKVSLALKYNRQLTKGGSKWPENWDGPVHGQSLGVDEFDLFMVSHAIERGLVLLTHERMKQIRDGLGFRTDLRFDDWSIPQS